MNEVELPGLDGRVPMAFLAALGTVRLLRENADPEARLSWSAETCSAALWSRFETVSEVATALKGVVSSIPEGGVLPGVPTDFPPLGAAPDKLRLKPAEMHDYVASLRTSLPPDQFSEAMSWLNALVTDLAVDKDGRCSVSLFTAPTGKQSMRTMLEKSLQFIQRHPDVLEEALISWRRYPDVTGENLDNQALFLAADASNGKASRRGVPGATWLALMALPLTLTTATNASSPISTGWHIVGASRSQRRLLLYPLWTEPLTPEAAIGLMEHPLLPVFASGAAGDQLRRYSIFQVCAAERQKPEGDKSAGILTPTSYSPAERRSMNRAGAPAKPGHRVVASAPSSDAVVL